MGTDGLVGDFTLIPKEQLSESLKERLNAATQAILRDSLKEVEALLKEHFPILERFADELVRREELDYDEIAVIFTEYGKPPKPLPVPLAPLPTPPPPPRLDGNGGAPVKTG
jgi:cell division protease FtsH